MGEKVLGVLFDFDDTLVNSRPAMEDALKENAELLAEFARQHGHASDLKRVQEKLMEIDWRMHVAFRYNRTEWWLNAVSELWPRLELPAARAENLTLRYWNTVAEGSVPYPDTVPTLQALAERGYRLAVVTDTDGTEGVKHMRLRKSNLMRFFEAAIVGGEDTERVKPDPAPFLLAASRLKLNPDECIMVGDRPYTDIKGAKRAGMCAIWLKRREWMSEEPADFVVSSLQEIEKILLCP